MKTTLLENPAELMHAIGKLRSELQQCYAYEQIIRDAYADRLTAEELQRVLDPTTGFRMGMETDLREMESRLDSLTTPLSELLRGLRDAFTQSACHYLHPDFELLYTLNALPTTGTQTIPWLDQLLARYETDPVDPEDEMRLEHTIRNVAWITTRVIVHHGIDAVAIFWMGMNPIWNDGDRVELDRLLTEHPEVIYRAVPVWGEMGL